MLNLKLVTFLLLFLHTPFCYGFDSRLHSASRPQPGLSSFPPPARNGVSAESIAGRAANSFGEKNSTLSLEYSGSALWSQITDFEIRGDYAYCIMPLGLFIIDISDPGHPKYVSKFFINETRSQSMRLFDHYAAIIGSAIPRGSLSIIDISDPTYLSRIAFITLHSTALYDIDIKGTTAYVAGGAGMFAVDLSIPSSPSLMSQDSTFTPYELKRISIRDNFLFAGDNNLSILDISDPSQPSLVSKYDIPMATADFVIDGNTIYIACISEVTPHSSSTLATLDISDPANPRLKSEYLLIGSTSTVAKNGHYIYMSNKNGLLVFDISNPDTSQIVGQLPLPGLITRIEVRDTLAFISTVAETVEPEFLGSCDSCACGGLNYPENTIGGDFMIVNISDSINPCLLQIFTSPSTHLTAISANETYAFIGDEFCDSIMIVGVSKDDSLEKKGGISIPGDIKAYAVKGNYLYVSYKDSGLNIYDITDPLHPEHLGRVSVPDGTHLEIHDALAFLGAGENGFYIIDIADQSNPHIIGHYAGNAASFRISGEYAYIVGMSGFFILSISNPSYPSLVSSYMTYATFIELKGDLAFINDYWDYLTILDVGAPANPTPLGTILIGAGFRGLALFDNFCIAANSLEGLTVVDISDPNFPVATNIYDTPGSAEAVLSVGSDIYVVDAWGIIRLTAQSTIDLVDTSIAPQLPTTTELLLICPNPANSIMSIRYQLIKTTDIRLEIYNILGQKIRTLFEGVQNFGIHHIEWDGTNQSRENVPSGVYFMILQSGSSRSIQKAAIVK